jgi:4-hydroxy-tetrahydrodipicolinate reductase
MTPDELARGGAGLSADLVVLDVSVAKGTLGLLEFLERSPRAVVAAGTGLDEAAESRIARLAQRAAVLRAPNLSLGNAVVLAWLRALPESALDAYEVDVVEHHHAGKQDAPSGTALALAAAIEAHRKARARPKGSPPGAAPGRETVAIHSIRSGAVPGTHRVLLAGAGETIEIVHTVHDRAVFARGALQAVRYLHGKPPGLYTVHDALLQR